MPKITEINGWKMTDVDSSVIKSVGFEPVHRDLFIEFKNGKQYIYHEVPEEEFEALIEAESVGSYFNAEIADEYDFMELGE